MRNLNTQLLLNRPLNLQQSRVAKLHDGLRLQVDEMVVLTELVGAFVLRTVVPELMLDDQTAVEQQVDSIILCGSTDAVLVVFHLVVQRVDVEMPIGRVNLLKDSKALGSLAQFPSL